MSALCAAHKSVSDAAGHKKWKKLLHIVSIQTEDREIEREREREGDSHNKQCKEPGAPSSQAAASIQMHLLLVLIFAVKSTCLICKRE